MSSLHAVGRYSGGIPDQLSALSASRSTDGSASIRANLSARICSPDLTPPESDGVLRDGVPAASSRDGLGLSGSASDEAGGVDGAGVGPCGVDAVMSAAGVLRGSSGRWPSACRPLGMTRSCGQRQLLVHT